MDFPFEGIPTVPPRKDMDHLAFFCGGCRWARWPWGCRAGMGRRWAVAAQRGGLDRPAVFRGGCRRVALALDLHIPMRACTTSPTPPASPSHPATHCPTQLPRDRVPRLAGGAREAGAVQGRHRARQQAGGRAQHARHPGARRTGRALGARWCAALCWRAAWPPCWPPSRLPPCHPQKWEDLELIYAGQRMANGLTLAHYRVPPVGRAAGRAGAAPLAGRGAPCSAAAHPLVRSCLASWEL